MDPSYEEALKAGDDYVAQSFEKKMSPVPTRVFPELKSKDIYALSAKTYNSHIPQDLPLQWYLKNWSAIQHFKDPSKVKSYLATKDCPNRDVTRAIFYYQLDPIHNFDYFFRDTRATLFVMLVVIAHPHPHTIPVTAEQLEFCKRYAWGWLETIIMNGETVLQDLFIDLWRTTDLDLIKFNDRQVRRIQYRQEELSKSVTELPTEASALLDPKRKLTIDEFNSVGPKMALHSLSFWHDIEKTRKEIAQLTTMMADGLSTADEVEEGGVAHLKEVNWQSEMVEAVIEDMWMKHS